MEISKASVEVVEGKAIYSSEVFSDGSVRNLIFSTDVEWMEYIDSSGDAALLALLIPAMVEGSHLNIKGEISERLYYAASGPLQHIFKIIMPKLQLIKVHAQKISRSKRLFKSDATKQAVAASFSGGVDSYCTISDFGSKSAPPGFQITHVIFNNVGSHGNGIGQKSLYLNRLNRVKKTTSRLGLPTIAIDSNLTEFYGALPFVTTHTPRNLAAALLMQKGISKFLYSSPGHYRDTTLKESNQLGWSDPCTVPLMSTEEIDTFAVGGQYSRLEKILKVSSFEDSYQGLDVCLGSGNQKPNCSACSKCQATMLILDIQGKLHHYEYVFDVNLYKQNRQKILKRMEQNERHPFAREIVEYAKSKSFASLIKNTPYTLGS